MKKNDYTPNPIDTSGIELPDELKELTEHIARNVHEVWAASRIAEGWTYGESHDYDKKHHPCLIPYEELPESEKEYDRNTAMGTLKLIQQLGFTIEKGDKKQQ